ncbi:hypothetical protein CES87_12435 [Pseudomonas sp. ERMR1:02]|nr:hypothetical protein CES87_12435 [Pseudomonas sp. ERMR1:02]
MGPETTRPPVGASLLAMVVNDNAVMLAPRGVLRFFASRLAPTGGAWIRPRRCRRTWAFPNGNGSPASAAGSRRIA